MILKQWRLLVVLVTILLTGCASSTFKERPDGIVIGLKKANTTDAGVIKIQVCAEDIFRVVAAPGNSFSTRESLIVPKSKWQTVPYSVKEQGDTIEISTDKITVKVSVKTGEVAFYDANGHRRLH